MSENQEPSAKGEEPEATSHEGGSLPRLREITLPCAAIVLSVVIAYAPVTQNGFIWDDDDYITNNETLLDLDGLRRIWLEPGAVPQYYPLVHTTFWIEHQLYGVEPCGYHVVNVVLHCWGAVQLFFVLRRLHVPGAWLCTLLFAVHPVHVESVAWATERKNVLSGLFYLIAFSRFLDYAKHGWGMPVGDGIGSRFPRLSYWASFTLFAMALLSKTVTCTLPCALLLVGWWKTGRVTIKMLAGTVPFLFIGVAFAFTTILMEKTVVGAEGDAFDWTFGQRFLIAGRAVWFYAWKLLVPLNLIFFYPKWPLDVSNWFGWLFPAAAVGVVVLLWSLRRRIGRGPLTAVLFFMGTLFPALGFINVYPMRYSFVADHFQYLASIGMLCLFGGALASLLDRLLGDKLESKSLPRGLPQAVAGLTIAACLIFLSFRQCFIYRDLETLWVDTTSRNPTSWVAYNNLGVLYVRRNLKEDALRQFEKSYELKPTDNDEAASNLLVLRGELLARQGKLDEGLAKFLEAIENYPKSTVVIRAHFMAGVILLEKGQSTEAAEQLRKSVEYGPDSPGSQVQYARALVEVGRIADAVDRYREVARRWPDRVDAQQRLAWILATHPEPEIRNGSEAVMWASRLTAKEKTVPAFDALAAAYAEAGRFDEAVELLEEVLARFAAKMEEDQRQALQSRRSLYESENAYRDPELR